MAFVGNTGIQLRRLDELVAHTVPSTEGGRSPFFSPDGLTLGFVDAEGNLKGLGMARVRPAQ